MDETKVIILDKDLKQLKSILADVQIYDKSIDVDNYKIVINKRLFINFNSRPIINENNYLNVSNIIFKVVKVNNFSDYQEVFITDIKNIKVNNIDRLAIIEDDKEKTIDYKTIITDFSIFTGNIVQYQNYNWIIVSEVSNNNTYKATIRRADHIIKMYIDDILNRIPAIIESSTQTIAESSQISVVEGNIKVTVQDNSITNKITYENTFIKMGSKWKVNGFTAENPGLKYLYCSNTQFGSNDDKDEEIADRWLHETKHNYILTVEPTELILNEGQTQQLNITVSDSNTPVVNPTIAIACDNTNIAAVSNTGLVNPVLEGNCNITITFVGQDNKSYSKTIPVTIKHIITDNITYDMTCNSSMGWNIKKTNTNTFYAKKYNNGVEVSAVFDFEVDRQGLTDSQVSITEVTNTYIKVKNVNVDASNPLKKIIIRCKEKGSSNWSVEKEVGLIGLL